MELFEHEKYFLEDIEDLGDVLTVSEIEAFTKYDTEEIVNILDSLKKKGFFETFGEKNFMWRRIK